MSAAATITAVKTFYSKTATHFWVTNSRSSDMAQRYGVKHTCEGFVGYEVEVHSDAMKSAVHTFILFNKKEEVGQKSYYRQLKAE
jgi:hypothetical protein